MRVTRDELRGVANVRASSIAHGLEAIGCKLAWSSGCLHSFLTSRSAVDHERAIR